MTERKNRTKCEFSWHACKRTTDASYQCSQNSLHLTATERKKRKKQRKKKRKSNKSSQSRLWLTLESLSHSFPLLSFSLSHSLALKVQSKEERSKFEQTGHNSCSFLLRAVWPNRSNNLSETMGCYCLWKNRSKRRNSCFFDSLDSARKWACGSASSSSSVGLCIIFSSPSCSWFSDSWSFWCGQKLALEASCRLWSISSESCLLVSRLDCYSFCLFIILILSVWVTSFYCFRQRKFAAFCVPKGLRSYFAVFNSRYSSLFSLLCANAVLSIFSLFCVSSSRSPFAWSFWLWQERPRARNESSRSRSHYSSSFCLCQEIVGKVVGESEKALQVLFAKLEVGRACMPTSPFHAI